MQASALCVGTVAYAMGGAWGGQLAVTALAGLAAIGLTLKAGCAAKACGDAEAAVMQALRAVPELSAKDLQQARAALRERLPTAHIDPRELAAHAGTEDFDGAVTGWLLSQLVYDRANPAVTQILTHALRAGFAACRAEPEFRANLTLEVVLHAARQSGILAEAVGRVETKISDLPAQFVALLREQGLIGPAGTGVSTKDLRELAAKFGVTDALSVADLLQTLAGKAEEYASYRAQIERIDERVAGLGNLKAAAREAAGRLDFAEVEAMLARVDQVETEIAAETKELRAANALLQGRAEDAYTHLCAAADSFAGIDPEEPARRRVAYWRRIYDHGLRYGGPGLALSVRMLQAAIASLNPATQPDWWAKAQNRLAIALRNQGSRTGGADGAALLARAITAYRAALAVYTQAEHPVGWAMAQNNLGIALSNQGIRTGGADGATLLAQAVTAFRAALTAFTQAEYPVDWAMAQNNLGRALRSEGILLGGADWAALLAEAVKAYQAAMTVFTEADHPVHWAMTKNNIGAALTTQGSGTSGVEGAALLADAVAACRAALTVQTQVEHPVHWATTQETMALAELARAHHDSTTASAPHLAAALEHVTAALRVYDPVHMPYDYGTATALRDEILAAQQTLKS